MIFFLPLFPTPDFWLGPCIWILLIPFFFVILNYRAVNSKPTKEGNLKTFWTRIILLNTWGFFNIARGRQLQMNFSQGKNRWVFNRKKRNRQICNYCSVTTSFPSPLCQLPSLSTHQHSPPRFILFRVLWSHVQSRLSRHLLGFLLQVKHTELSSRGLGIEIFRILGIWPAERATEELSSN